MVRKERLELSQVAPLEPKSSASTNFATFARHRCLPNPAKRGVIMPPLHAQRQIQQDTEMAGLCFGGTHTAQCRPLHKGFAPDSALQRGI